MSSPEEQMAAVIANLEATDELADQLDRLKTGLENRGWSTPAAEQASIVTTNTVMQLSAMRYR